MKKVDLETRQTLLASQIKKILIGTVFVMSKCEIAAIFDNVIVEMRQGDLTYRIIQDRGDIYLDKKFKGEDTWKNQQLLHSNFNKAEDDATPYHTILQAIKKIIATA